MGNYISKFCPCVKDNNYNDEEISSEMINLKDENPNFQKKDLNENLVNRYKKDLNNYNEGYESKKLRFEEDKNMKKKDIDLSNEKKRDNNDEKDISEKNQVKNEKQKKELINKEKEEDNLISLGINIGASKTVYSIFSKINDKYISHVLLMNNSSRIIPSIICYTKDHRLFGENSISSLKQNLSTSYNNLSRIIGFDNSDLYKEELKYMFTKDNNINDYNFYCYDKNQKKQIIKSEYIIADYLSLIKEYYFEKENIEYDFTTISVPDFYNINQREELKLICEAIGMKDIEIINESSAITMYYGYTKYSDLFVETNEKNILFIDIGYSKSSFILSNFKYDEFKVEYVDYIENIGGRNFDYLIYEYCINEFKKNNTLDEINDRMRYRLIEEIMKKRVQLTVNDGINFVVESFYDEEELNIYLKKEHFEEIIKNIIEEINKKFEQILNYSKENNINIDYVEIAGELMRTPILQKMIKDKNLKISKTILIDECTSVGACILRSFNNNKFPISKLKNFYQYNNQKILGEFNKKKEEYKKDLKKHIENQHQIDFIYHNFIDEKTRISKYFYSIKNKIINNPNSEEILKELNLIDKEIRKANPNNNTLNSIEDKLKKLNKEKLL